MVSNPDSACICPETLGNLNHSILTCRKDLMHTSWPTGKATDRTNVKSPVHEWALGLPFLQIQTLRQRLGWKWFI